MTSTVHDLRSGLLCDAMDALALPSNACGGFTLSNPRAIVVGRAFTLRQVAIADLPDGEARHGEAAEHLVRPGDILIIDVPAGLDVATWGEGHTLRALASGAAGVVVNGAIRDVAAVGSRDLPVLYRTSSPKRSKDRLVTAEVGGFLEIGGVRIAPGDLVCFDADGLTVVPASVEAVVLEKVAEIRDWEHERDARLESRLQAAGGAPR